MPSTLTNTINERLRAAAQSANNIDALGAIMTTEQILRKQGSRMRDLFEQAVLGLDTPTEEPTNEPAHYVGRHRSPVQGKPFIDQVSDALRSNGLENDIVAAGYYDGQGRFEENEYEDIIVYAPKDQPFCVHIRSQYDTTGGLSNPLNTGWDVSVDDECNPVHDTCDVPGASYGTGDTQTANDVSLIVSAVKKAFRNHG